MPLGRIRGRAGADAGLSGTRRRSVGPTVHVAIVVSRRSRAGPARRVLGHRPGARAAPFAERRRGHRRGPDGAARWILDRDGKVLATNATDSNDEVYRVYAGSAISQVVGYASPRYGRAGLERAYDAELAGLAGDPLTDAFAKFGADRYDPKELTLSLSYDLQRAAVAALGNHRGAVVMLDPKTGESWRWPPRRPTTRRPSPTRAPPTRCSRTCGRPGAAAPPAGDAGPVRAGVGVQDRDGGGRARLGRDHAGHHLQEPAGGGEDRVSCGRLPRP